MRHPLLLALLTLAVGIFVGSQFARAVPDDHNFTLNEGDTIIAEAPGCYASCQGVGTIRRCTIREPACHAVCRSLPQCRVAGALKPMQACAVVRDSPY